MDGESGGALILAAGFGRRFGADKRRHLLDGETPMLIRTLARYVDAFDNVAVVIRDEDCALAEEIQSAHPGVRVIWASDAQLGMGHSLAAGIRSVHEEWRYVCVGLGDMPHVSSHTLRHLLAIYLAGDPGRIVQPVFDDRPGHPVFFGARYFPEIERLTGDAGARSLLRAHATSVLRVPVHDSGVIDDVDTPPDHV